MTSEDLVVAVFDALGNLAVPFMVSGSLAANFYGVPRATQDADLVLELSRLPIEEFARRLAAHFDVDSQIAFETVTGSRRIVARARDSAFQVELFDLTDDPHDHERFARRLPVQVLGRTVMVPAAEDVIVNKLRWWRLAGRPKDFEDARNVVAVQGATLDRAYLDAWCRDLDLLEELAKITKALEQ